MASVVTPPVVFFPPRMNRIDYRGPPTPVRAQKDWLVGCSPEKDWLVGCQAFTSLSLQNGCQPSITIQESQDEVPILLEVRDRGAPVTSTHWMGLGTKHHPHNVTPGQQVFSTSLGPSTQYEGVSKELQCAPPVDHARCKERPFVAPDGREAQVPHLTYVVRGFGGAHTASAWFSWVVPTRRGPTKWT